MTTPILPNLYVWCKYLFDTAPQLREYFNEAMLEQFILANLDTSKVGIFKLPPPDIGSILRLADRLSALILEKRVPKRTKSTRTNFDGHDVQPLLDSVADKIISAHQLLSNECCWYRLVPQNLAVTLGHAALTLSNLCHFPPFLSGQCFAGKDELADKFLQNCSRATLFRHIEQLESAGWIQRINWNYVIPAPAKTKTLNLLRGGIYDGRLLRFMKYTYHADCNLGWTWEQQHVYAQLLSFIFHTESTKLQPYYCGSNLNLQQATGINHKTVGRIIEWLEQHEFLIISRGNASGNKVRLIQFGKVPLLNIFGSCIMNPAVDDITPGDFVSLDGDEVDLTPVPTITEPRIWE